MNLYKVTLKGFKGCQSMECRAEVVAESLEQAVQLVKVELADEFSNWDCVKVVEVVLKWEFK